MKIKLLFIALLLSLASCKDPSVVPAPSRNQLLDIGYTEQELLYIALHPKVTYAAEVNHPPYIYQKDDKLVGISQEYLDLISQKTGIIFVPKKVNVFVDGLDALRAREIDLLPTTRINEDRLLYLSFSRMYSKVAGVQVSTDQIDGDPKTAGIALGFAVKKWLETDKPNIKIVEYPTDSDSIKALSEGKVQSSMMDIATYYWIKPLSDKATVVKEIPFEYPYHFAVLKSDVQLVRIIDKALVSTTPEERAAIEAKWIKKE